MRENEASLKAKLVLRIKERRPSFVTLRHEDVRSSGHPDISVTGEKRTAWIEVKHADPEFKSHGIQELTMQRLEAQGLALYVVYERSADGKRQTHVFKPSQMKDGKWPSVGGYSHDYVVTCIEDLLHLGY